ncbi:M50 family metallopeptidase [Streptomyces cinereoruber]|uniref:M50 family metallopeptidase n=1 Tax=Streptomyces cinereoruber TaxID=67260 RepID=UPI003639115E
MNDIVGTQPAPDEWIVWVTAGCALVLVAVRGLWLPARNAITIAHEGGHGIVALATGRRLEGIRLHSDTSGLTVSRGRPTGLGIVLTLAAGYPAAPLLGLGGAALIGTHRTTLLLWAATALLLALLVMVRNAYGILTVLLTSAAFLLVSLFTGPDVQGAFACAAVWFLLLGGVRPAFELQAKRRRGGAPDSDADQLARLTHVPAGVWLIFFHTVSICCLIGGGRWLLRL